MDLKFRVAARIARPVHEVFEAVADPGQAVELFHDRRGQGPARDRRDGDLGLRTISPGAFPVQVIEVEPDRKIVLEWKANEGEPPNVEGGEMTAVQLQYDRHHDLHPARRRQRTMVEIEEKGWRETRGRAEGELRQLPRLGADARGAEGLGRIRHQPSRGDVRFNFREANDFLERRTQCYGDSAESFLG